MARAQASTLREVARTHKELADIGLRQQYLVINGVLPASAAKDDELAAAVVAREQAAIEAIPPVLSALPLDQIALKPFNLVGLDALHHLLDSTEAPVHAPATTTAEPLAAPSLASLVDEIAAARIHSPLLLQRAANERNEIDAVAKGHAQRYALVPLLKDEPVGQENLQAL